MIFDVLYTFVVTFWMNGSREDIYFQNGIPINHSNINFFIAKTKKYS